jgi:hypothetical protein
MQSLTQDYNTLLDSPENIVFLLYFDVEKGYVMKYKSKTHEVINIFSGQKKCQCGGILSSEADRCYNCGLEIKQGLHSYLQACTRFIDDTLSFNNGRVKHAQRKDILPKIAKLISEELDVELLTSYLSKVYCSTRKKEINTSGIKNNDISYISGEEDDDGIRVYEIIFKIYQLLNDMVAVVPHTSFNIMILTIFYFTLLHLEKYEDLCRLIIIAYNRGFKLSTIGCYLCNEFVPHSVLNGTGVTYKQLFLRRFFMYRNSELYVRKLLNLQEEHVFVVHKSFCKKFMSLELSSQDATYDKMFSEFLDENRMLMSEQLYQLYKKTCLL